MAEGMADAEVAVLTRLSPAATIPDGVRIVARHGSVASCRLPRGAIPAVHEAPSIKSMKAPKWYGPTPIESADAEGGVERTATDLRRPEGIGPTGKGVIVAHIDWGVDV